MKKTFVPFITFIGITYVIIQSNNLNKKEFVQEKTYFTIENLRSRVQDDEKKFGHSVANGININDFIKGVEDEITQFNGTIFELEDIQGKLIQFQVG